MIKDRQKQSELEEKIIQISRVSKKTKGGNKIGFSVLMVVGDKKGRVGVALGKAPTVAAAIRKGVKKAKKKMIVVPMKNTTIPFEIEIKKRAGRILLKPAPNGSGVIAGGPVRSVVDAAGIRDISGKILGSQNKASSVYATFAALKEIARLVELKNIKLVSTISKSPVTPQPEKPATNKTAVVQTVRLGKPVVKKDATVVAPKPVKPIKEITQTKKAKATPAKVLSKPSDTKKINKSVKVNSKKKPVKKTGKKGF